MKKTQTTHGNVSLSTSHHIVTNFHFCDYHFHNIFHYQIRQKQHNQKNVTKFIDTDHKSLPGQWIMRKINKVN